MSREGRRTRTRAWALRGAAVVIAIATVIGLASPAWAIGIFIRPEGGSNLPLDVEPSDTIENVKQKILDRYGYPVEDQLLYFVSVLLDDARTLSDYSIARDDVITLVLRSDPTETSASAPMPMWLQSYARAAQADACAEGWSPSWGRWVNDGAGGWTCDRLLPAYASPAPRS